MANFDKSHQKPRRDIQVTIYNSGGTTNHNPSLHENSHNVTHTTTTDSYNNSSRNHIPVADPRSLQNLANENQSATSVLNTDGTERTDLVYDAQEISSIASEEASAAQAATAQPPRQTDSVNIPPPGPEPFGSSAGKNIPSVKSKNPFKNPFNPFWCHPSQSQYPDTMAPGQPLAFRPQPYPQSSQWERFLDGVGQDGFETEERADGSIRRCPTCGSLSAHNFFPASSHLSRFSLDQPYAYGPLSQHPFESYARSYLSSSLHGALPRTPCGLCGTFHTSADYQAAVQTMNPFTLPRPYWCPLFTNSFSSSFRNFPY